MAAARITRFSHEELNLLVFALEGCPDASQPPEPPSCEDSCPAISNLQDVFGGGAVPTEKRLASHLSSHLREGMVECGLLDLARPDGAGFLASVNTDNPQVKTVNERLRRWRCEISLDDSEVRILREAIGRLPRTAWVSMPRFLWRLRKKLKARASSY